MESLTKRILAIVIIAVVGVGIGVTVWFLVAPYAWSAKDCPGLENRTDITPDQIIRFGVLGDFGEIQGDGQWEGAYLAAKEINLAGGLTINGKKYYIGLTREDTDESNPNIVTSRGVAAAERIVFNKKIQFATGGFRSESLLAYQEVLMENKIPFIDTGAATDIFTMNVKGFPPKDYPGIPDFPGSNYEKYKYFFRVMPINSSSLGKEILYYLAFMIKYLNTTYPNEEVRTVGILAEDLTWVDPLVDAIQQNLPLVLAAFGYPGWVTNDSIIANTIKYDITLKAADMAQHLEDLNSKGCDIVVPVISAQGGILMMQQYNITRPNYVIIGIDVQSQLDTFYTLTGGACAYETILQSVYNTNKTDFTKTFWSNFLAEFDHEPLYTAVGSYDAIKVFTWAINQSQSFNADTIVATMETINKQNYIEGASGRIAFWGNHEIVEGYPFGYTLFCQWRADGTKVVVPTSNIIYSDSIATGAYEVAPWVHTTWTT
ncbi:MAG: ABC transporter substrate-binding protein [Promethearchaeota archaeon]